MSKIRSRLLGIRLRLQRPQAASSWQQAVDLAGTSSYQDEALTRFRVMRMSLNHQRGTMPKVPDPVARAIDWLVERLAASDVPAVVDFGGADGAFLRLLRARLPRLKGTVVESEALVQSLPPEMREPLVYASALPADFDVFYSACALNYVAEPSAVLEQAFSRARVAVVLQRNCFSNTEQFRVQVSSLHANGWGELPVGWPDRFVRYAHRTLVPDHIMALARRQGFELVTLIGNSSGVIGRPGSGHFGVDLFFVRRAC